MCVWLFFFLFLFFICIEREEVGDVRFIIDIVIS